MLVLFLKVPLGVVLKSPIKFAHNLALAERSFGQRTEQEKVAQGKTE